MSHPKNPSCPAPLKLCSSWSPLVDLDILRIPSAPMGRSLLPATCAISTDLPPNDWAGATYPKPLPSVSLSPAALHTLLSSDSCGRFWQCAHKVSWLLSRPNFTGLFPHYISNLSGPLEIQSQSWLILNSPVLVHLWISLVCCLLASYKVLNEAVPGD